MMLKAGVALLSTAMTVGADGAVIPACEDLPAHLEGSVAFRGDQWLVRLHVAPRESGAGAVAAQLDIPDLIMTGRPAQLSCVGDAWLIELPFGLGEVTLNGRADAGYRGSAALAGDSVRVTLARSNGPPYTGEDVVFRNGDVELRGTLFIPHGSAPHPAVVMVHGSGPQSRQTLEYRSWADFYARRGVATLVYDKRGVGESDGDYRADSAFVGLTGDALAAVRYLRRRPEIARDRIGLSGASQAGWIAYRAAADPSIAFVALFVPPSVSVAEQEIQRVRAGMRADGFDAAAVDAAVAHTRLLMAVAVLGAGWDALVKSTARVASERWAERVHRPQAFTDLRWWRDHANVDPHGDLHALQVPLFAAFSLDDDVVPSAQNAGVLRELAAARAGHDITIVTAPRGNHRLEVPAGRDVHGQWHLPRVSREVTDALTRWLKWRLER